MIRLKFQSKGINLTTDRTFEGKTESSDLWKDEKCDDSLLISLSPGRLNFYG